MTVTQDDHHQTPVLEDHQDEKEKTRKPHLLSACVWAADTYKPRGNSDMDTEEVIISDTKQRLIEWITFHLLVGFDHFYIYDNSGAYNNESSLADVASTFPPTKVTIINWPFQICNNNVPSHDNVGERSSQYAAENSCLIRYRPFSEWLIHFDIDE